ncbi:MAG: NUDIX hydrolase [Bacteroidota bacterium]
MAPTYRLNDLLNTDNHLRAVKSSIMILFFEKSGDYYIPFIKRPLYDGVHSGQIAFPGGRWESTDKSMYHTALRETREEIGIKPEKVRFAGKLTDLYIPPSNYIVSPFVGIYHSTDTFIADPSEVAEIIEIPFSFFLQPDVRQEAQLTLRDGRKITTPAFRFNNEIIWGATAMIMNELIVLWKTTVKYR